VTGPTSSDGDNKRKPTEILDGHAAPNLAGRPSSTCAVSSQKHLLRLGSCQRWGSRTSHVAISG